MDHVLCWLMRLDRFWKRGLQILADAVVIGFSLGVAMVLRLDSVAFLADPGFWLTLCPVVLITTATFSALGLYRSVIRYFSAPALRVVLLGTLASAAALLAISYLGGTGIPRSVPIIHGVVLFMLISGLRFLTRWVLCGSRAKARTPVLIYGAGEAGRQLAGALLQAGDYVPAAFLDDDVTLRNTMVAGRQVHAPCDLGAVIEATGIRTILLAIPSLGRTRKREIIALLKAYDLDVKTVPGLSDIVSGRTTFADLRRIQPEELLGRDPVPPNPDLMRRNIADKTVLVTGAGGSIGSELCRQIIQHHPRALVLLEASEFALYSIVTELRETLGPGAKTPRIEPVLASVQNADRVRAIIQGFGVETIYHAAAYKHVVLVEENAIEGIRNNVFGTQVVAQAAADLRVESFILISTDKAVRPTNIMGASKRMAELVCQALAEEYPATTFSMVRFGNVLGSSGSVIPRFRSQIERGGPVTVTHRDITRFFMTIPEAAQLVIQAGAMARGGEAFVLDMGEPVRILDLARSMIKLHGLTPYVLDAGTTAQPDPPGDIAITITGLQKGEKLFEELLIGNEPTGTEHPRIMSASESHLPRHRLYPFLEDLSRACRGSDLVAIRSIFLDAPLDYCPTSDDLHDLTWNAAKGRAAVAAVMPIRQANTAGPPVPEPVARLQPATGT